jgi:hypothetical protein
MIKNIFKVSAHAKPLIARGSAVSMKMVPI